MGNEDKSHLIEDIKKLPLNVKDSIIRHGPVVSDRTRSQAVFSNLFLHLHATRIHIRSLKFSSTMAMGIASLSLFIILTVTGVLLMVYYKASTDLAYNSIKDIHFVVPAGRLLRNLHRWGAHLMVVAVGLHMIRVFYTACYKKGREFNWVIGMILFVLTLVFSFTGYLLPWDQLAYWAVTIGANIAASPSELTDALGLTQYFDVGALSKEMLLGASTVGQEALNRFYVLHVMVLPIALTALLGIHFWRIRKDGGLGKPGIGLTTAGKGTLGDEEEKHIPADSPSKTYGLMCVVRDKTVARDVIPENTVPSWPYLLRAEALVFMVTLLLCLCLAATFDAPLTEAANPNVPENPAKAPWYFVGLQELVSYSAFTGGVGIPVLLILSMLLLPYLDREKEELGVYFNGKCGKIIALKSAIFSVIVTVLAVAVPVKFGWLRNWFPGISQLAIIIINPGTLLILAYLLWMAITYKKTGSTRLSAIAVFTCMVIGFSILIYVGGQLRGPNWDFYWTKSSWPIH